MAKKLSGPDKAMVEWFVDSFHVGMTDAEVEQKIRTGLERGARKKGMPLDPVLADLAVRYAIKTHHRNRDLYARVMGGRLNPGRRSHRINADEWVVMRDGKDLARFDTESKAAGWLLRHQSQSILWAVNYEGYDIQTRRDGKTIHSYAKAWHRGPIRPGERRIGRRSRGNPAAIHKEREMYDRDKMWLAGLAGAAYHRIKAFAEGDPKKEDRLLTELFRADLTPAEWSKSMGIPPPTGGHIAREKDRKYDFSMLHYIYLGRPKTDVPKFGLLFDAYHKGSAIPNRGRRRAGRMRGRSGSRRNPIIPSGDVRPTYYSTKGRKMGRVRVYGKMVDRGWTWYAILWHMIHEPWAKETARFLSDHGIHVQIVQRGRYAGEPYWYIFVPEHELSPIPGLLARKFGRYQANPPGLREKGPLRATAHKGPKGGVEYRLWTGEDTFLVVGKYKALPHMSEEEKAKAAEMEAVRARARKAKLEHESAWRAIMSGRTEIQPNPRRYPRRLTQAEARALCRQFGGRNPRSAKNPSKGNVPKMRTWAIHIDQPDPIKGRKVAYEIRYRAYGADEALRKARKILKDYPGGHIAAGPWIFSGRMQ